MRKEVTMNRLEQFTERVLWSRIPVRFARVVTLLAILAVVAALAGYGFGAIWNSEVPEIVRDAAYGLVAHQLAGLDIPFAPDYVGGDLVNKLQAWDINSNSLWLVQQTTKIVPYFAYEDLTDRGLYPSILAWIPMTNERSFHVLGTAYTDEYVIYLNDRTVTDPRFNDQREALETLVHELIHIQGGLFADDPAPDWATKSAHLESATEAATIEVLAAMCNYGDKIACLSFWSSTEGLARSSRSEEHTSELQSQSNLVCRLLL